jgi:hypothetical protein
MQKKRKYSFVVEDGAKPTMIFIERWSTKPGDNGKRRWSDRNGKRSYIHNF